MHGQRTLIPSRGREIADAVERHWGRIGAAGQSKMFWLDDVATADQTANLVSATKARHRYLDQWSAAGGKP